MGAELTDEQIDAARDAFDWDGWIEPKNAQRAFARTILELATKQATQGAEPDGWLYVMHMEGGQKNKAFSDDRYDFPTHSPFGRRGRDYSEEYEVTEHPVHLTAPPPTAEVEKDARRWADIVMEKARHATENAKGLRKFEGMEPEARARELAASYLLETAESLLLDHRLAALQSDQAQAGRGSDDRT